MRYRKRAFWIGGIVGALVLTVVAVSVLLRPPAYPSITLSDGRLFSLAGVTAGKELPQSVKPTWLNRNIGIPIVKYLPKLEPILCQIGIAKPYFPQGLNRNLQNDGITFWILTRSTDGSICTNSGDRSRPEAVTVNGVYMEFWDEKTKMRLRPTRVWGLIPSADLSYTFIHFYGIRNQTERVTVILHQANNRRAPMEELATWNIEIP